MLQNSFRLKCCAKFNLELLNAKEFPILKKRGVGPIVFKFASLAIIDCMTEPDYSFSYPSYRYLADRVLLGKTSISEHIRLVENSGLFRVKKLSADACKDYLWLKYGHSITTNYPRGPAVYEINYQSPFWAVLKEKIDKGLKGTRLKVPQKEMEKVLDLVFHSPKSRVTDSSKVVIGS